MALLAFSCTWKVKTLSVDPPQVARSTIIYDKNGDVITYFRGEQHRLVVQNLDEIPIILQNAVIAIEDERFWQHNGIDVRSIARAARSNISQGAILEGGSTITQQYVGLIFLDRTNQSTSRKVEEIALALQFERLYSKQFILREYLNVVYFGEGAYGIKAAAQEFFDKDLNEITIAESALLAGIIQAPTTFNPYFNQDRAIARRSDVLEKMLKQGLITQKEYDIARTEPLTLKPRVAVLDETYIAPYFVEEVRQWILRNLQFGETRAERVKLLFEGGLHIYTTLDPNFQKVAESAVRQTLPDIENLGSAVVVLENDTGFVRALIGGRDFFGDDPEARFNIATQGGRQAGSAMKPVVLAAAIEQGIDISTTYSAPPRIDIPIAGLPVNWEVKGGRDEPGKISLYEGLVHSVNTVYAQLSQDVGPINSAAMGERLGIQTPLDPILSIVLGSEDVSPLDLASLYSTFARRGIKVEPSFVTRIANANGTLIYEHTLGGSRELDRNISDQVAGAMIDVVKRGTGTRARVPGITIAGKTGTSTNYADATFVGFSPQYTTSVWVGFPSAQIPMEPPLTPIRVTGGSYPAEIFQKTMSGLELDRTRTFVNVIDYTEPDASLTAVRPDFFRLSSVVGLSRKVAVTQIDAMGLVAGIKEELAVDDTDPNLNLVKIQSPGGFALVSSGDVVTLTIVVLPDDCRDFIELVQETDIRPKLLLDDNNMLTIEKLAINLPVLSENFTVPDDCDDLLEELAKNTAQNTTPSTEVNN